MARWSCGDLIAVSIYEKYSVGPSVRPVCTRCCFAVARMMQMCRKFARVFIINTRPDEIARANTHPDVASTVRADLTQCINCVVLESQLPHLIVDLLF